MNDIYLYDNTLDSLLALIVELIKKRIVPFDIQTIENQENNLFTEIIYLEIENISSNLQLLKKYITPKIYKSIYYVYLSNFKQKEILLYKFIKLALVYQEKVFYQRRSDTVNQVIRLGKQVANEAHKLKGFIRFQELENHCLYAKIAPTHNILFLITPHFQKRLKKENWLIEDENRKLYALYNLKQVYYINSNIEISIQTKITKTEEEMASLWKVFHQTIAIKERTNKKCQQNFMPKKYWKNMLEMEEEL